MLLRERIGTLSPKQFGIREAPQYIVEGEASSRASKHIGMGQDYLLFGECEL